MRLLDRLAVWWLLRSWTKVELTSRWDGVNPGRDYTRGGTNA